MFRVGLNGQCCLHVINWIILSLLTGSSLVCVEQIILKFSRARDCWMGKDPPSVTLRQPVLFLTNPPPPPNHSRPWHLQLHQPVTAASAPWSGPNC